LDWHFGEIATAQAKIAEAITLAKKLNDMHGLAVALCYAAFLGHHERNPAEVDRFASNLIELSTRQNFPYWLVIGSIFRGWALSASGNPQEGISWIDDAIRDRRASGSVLALPYYLALKAEALHLADRTSEALEAINEAEALAERFEQREHYVELQRLRGVFLTAIGANEVPIEASFCEAIRIAREQKSVSLGNRAEATYAEYRRRKANQEVVDSDYLFANFLERPALRSTVVDQLESRYWRQRCTSVYAFVNSPQDSSQRPVFSRMSASWLDSSL